ncbi:MAG: threonine synthase [Armatimonadetes bacterium]|nr:threonine synthase [Armatimonadota bacterium]NIM23762.1 threonine synthase [Armatimonadota bacterium]NIM67639.1 threonine synthase [Armatimonadota bacterium]NIM76155.1 threonine synthase [Armatimonadota bacterium]NIN05840.1 threonine synthase [Armatimonadota bacterium]
MPWGGIIQRYRRFLPITEETPIITLNEGDTPLLPAPALAERIELNISLYLKCEGFNPTGSFKDRGMTVAISKALEEGSQAVICASTGNTAASAAAYSARAKLKCMVLLPHGSIALGKLAQSITHGAKVVALKGNFDDAFRLVKEACSRHPITLVNSINPYRIEGQKSGAFEICDVLGDAPTYHAIPVGNAGNICAYWKGYCEYHEAGISRSRPRMLGFQAEGAAPIVRGEPVEAPETIATAIRIGNPASWKGAEAARDESGGLIQAVSDEEILEAYHMLASVEGVFVEPASAASVAGVRKLAGRGYFKDASEDASVVCILTGHGLKDPDLAISQAAEPSAVEPQIEVVEEFLGLCQPALV